MRCCWVFGIREWSKAVEGIQLLAQQKLLILWGIYKIVRVLQIFSFDFNKLKWEFHLIHCVKCSSPDTSPIPQVRSTSNKWRCSFDGGGIQYEQDYIVLYLNTCPDWVYLNYACLIVEIKQSSCLTYWSLYFRVFFTNCTYTWCAIPQPLFFKKKNKL